MKRYLLLSALALVYFAAFICGPGLTSDALAKGTTENYKQRDLTPIQTLAKVASSAHKFGSDKKATGEQARKKKKPARLAASSKKAKKSLSTSKRTKGTFAKHSSKKTKATYKKSKASKRGMYSKAKSHKKSLHKKSKTSKKRAVLSPRG